MTLWNSIAIRGMEQDVLALPLFSCQPGLLDWETFGSSWLIKFDFGTLLLSDILGRVALDIFSSYCCKIQSIHHRKTDYPSSL